MSKPKVEIILNKDKLLDWYDQGLSWKDVLHLWNDEREQHKKPTISYPLFMYHMKNLDWRPKQKTPPTKVQVMEPELEQAAATIKLNNYPANYNHLSEDQAYEIKKNGIVEQYIIYSLGDKPDDSPAKKEIWEEKRYEVFAHIDDLVNLYEERN